MDETIRYILKNKRTQIKIGEYLTILIPTIGMCIVGFAMLYNVYQFDHLDLLLPAFIVIVGAILIMIFSLKKLLIENTYDLISTGLTINDNIVLCESIIDELFETSQIYGDKNQGLLYFNIDSLFSWGKQITMICSEREILLNFRDIRAPFTLISRGIYMNRIKNRIDKKLSS